MKRILAATFLVALSGCAVSSDPIVSSFNGDSVTLIQPVFAAFSDAQLLAAANSICQRGNRKVAERVSGRVLPQSQGTEYLFLCLDNP